MGVWHGTFFNQDAPWLRWYDSHGNLLPIGEELAVQERRRAEEAVRRADEERHRADEERLRSRSLGGEVARTGRRSREILTGRDFEESPGARTRFRLTDSALLLRSASLAGFPPMVL